MDKRNFIFIMIFSLALLGVNTGFQYWTSSQKALYLEQKAAYELFQQKKAQQQILQEIAQVTDLQLIPTDVEDCLALGCEGATVLIHHPAPPNSFNGLPLLSIQSSQPTCAIYLDSKKASNSLLLQASKAFADSEVAVQSVSLLTKQNGLVTCYPASLDNEMNLLSALSLDEGGFDTKQISYGLLLLRFDNQHVPVAAVAADSSGLVATPFTRLESLSKLITTSDVSAVQTSERFLMLENEYLQLVISTKGGGVAEINLPFQETSEASVVAEVENDRLLVEQAPLQAQFPLHLAEKVDAKGVTSTAIPSRGGYYALLRRSLADSSNLKADKNTKGPKPQDYALSLVSDYPEVSELNYKVIEMSASKVVLEATQAHRRIRRVYELPSKGQEPYVFNFEMKIEGEKRGLWLSSGIPEAEVGNGSPAPTLKYRISQNGAPDIENFDPPKDTIALQSLYPDWICNGNSFFALILDPMRNQFPGVKLEQVSGEQLPSRLSLIDAKWQKYSAASLPGYRMLLPVSAGEGSTMKLRVFAGPLSETVLKHLDEVYSDLKTDYNPEYLSCLSFTGWFSFILRPFAKFMMMLMNLFYALSHSWVASILLLTLALRLMLFPLNAWSNRSMRVMQELSPKIKSLQEKHKNDPKRLQLEMVTLYREHKVNPMSGCLPIVIQMPFLFSMLHLFKTNFALRGASFIPGWIDDLASPDVLFSWGYPLPIVGSDFHLLPILLGLAMFLQSHLMNPTTTGAATDAQRQQKMMGNVMTFAFTFMFYSLPSGLNIYWLASSLLGMLQQVWQQRQRAKLQSL